MNDGEIWLIDNDADDQEMVVEILYQLQLSNELVILPTSDDALKQMENTVEAPFMILCALNLTPLNGFDLRREFLSHSSKKYHTVPFIFWSASPSERQIETAYELSAHGFFVKDSNYKEFKETFLNIIRYWQKSKMPSKLPKSAQAFADGTTGSTINSIM